MSFQFHPYSAGRDMSVLRLSPNVSAETTNVMDNARAKLVRKNVDLLVVNDVSAPGTGFDHDTNAVSILKADGSSTEIPLTSKYAVANAVLDSVITHTIAHKNQKRSSP